MVDLELAAVNGGTRALGSRARTYLALEPCTRAASRLSLATTTLRNLSRNLALAHVARASYRLLERLLDYSIRPCTYYT